MNINNWDSEKIDVQEPNIQLEVGGGEWGEMDPVCKELQIQERHLEWDSI